MRLEQNPHALLKTAQRGAVMLKHSRSRRGEERGQVVVLFALLVPVILAIGSIVMSVGNWYVLKRHLQTQVDAAALAGGPEFTGCAQDSGVGEPSRSSERRRSSTRVTRSRSPATRTTSSSQEPGDQRVVLNSARTGRGRSDRRLATHDLDNSLGHSVRRRSSSTSRRPTTAHRCSSGGSRSSRASRRGRRSRSARSRARTACARSACPRSIRSRSRCSSSNENGASESTHRRGPSAQVLRRAATSRRPAPHADSRGCRVWRRTSSRRVDLNGNDNFGVIIVASRTPSVESISHTGSLRHDLQPEPDADTLLRGEQRSTSGISFIHAYSRRATARGTRRRPRRHARRRLQPDDLSRPYFNVDEAAARDRHLRDRRLRRRRHRRPDPARRRRAVSARSVTRHQAARSPYSADQQRHLWDTARFTPAVESGRNTINLSVVDRPNGGCNGGNSASGNFNKVASRTWRTTPPARCSTSRLEDSTSGGLANSMNKDVDANLDVTVGLIAAAQPTPAE